MTILGALALAGPAQAEDFSLDHIGSGGRDASAEGSVTFTDDGGATISITVTDRSPDGACAKTWVTSNLPSSTHKTFEACKAAVQNTQTVQLPGGAHCNVTFVEVQVGTIDHSEGDKVQLGESRRMNNPCPPVATPTPMPIPAPPPPPTKIDAGLDFTWTAFRRWTLNDKFLVSDIPAGAAVELRCSGKHKGCPGKRKSVPVRNGKANIHRILRHRKLRVGAELEVRITRPDMIGKVTRFKVRPSKIPVPRKYCLPPGALKPARC